MLDGRIDKGNLAIVEKEGMGRGEGKIEMVDRWAEMGGVASHGIKNMPISVFSSIFAFVPIRTQDTDQAGRKFCCLGDEPRLGENKQIRFCPESQADEMAISVPGPWNIVSQNFTRRGPSSSSSLVVETSPASSRSRSAW